eukprot:g3415.t1
MSKQKILICGGGIIGTATAFYLSERDVSSTIIEKRTIAGAASGKAAGFLVSDWNKDTHIAELSELSFSLHKKLAERFGTEIDFRHVSAFGIASTEDEVRQLTQHQLPSWMDGKILGYQVLGNQNTCAQVHPYKLTNAMLTAAMEKGTSVKEGTVDGIEWDDLGGKTKTATGHSTVFIDTMFHTGVIVDDEVIPADVVVLAMGPWTKQAVQWLPVPPVSAHKYHSILLQPKGEISADVIFLNHLMSDGRKMEPEIYPRPNGEVYICGAPQALALPDDPNDISVDPELCNEIHNASSSISSLLTESEVKKSQSCYLPLSPDGVPIIGKVPQTENVYIATGHSCWGILNAPGTGLIMSEMILDGTATSLDASVFDPKRFISTRS